MSGMRKGSTSKRKTQAMSSKTKTAVSSSSSTSHPGSSSTSSSRPQCPLAPKRRNILIEEKEDEIVDWMAHSSSQSQQDDVPSECDTMPLSQASQWSSCSSSCQPHRSVPLQSSRSPQHPPSGAPSFNLRRGHQTPPHTLTHMSESLPVDFLQSSQSLEVRGEAGDPIHGCVGGTGSSSGTRSQGGEGRGSGSYSGSGGTFRVGNLEGDQGAQHKLSHSDKSGVEVEESDDDCVLDRTWEPDRGTKGEEESSVEKGGGCGGNREKRQCAARTSKRAVRDRSASIVGSLGTGDAADTVGAGSKHAGHSPSCAACSSVPAIPVWHFFSTRPAHKTTAVCKICRIKIRCGHSNTNIGTRALLKHMRRHHRILLENRSGQHSQTQQVCPPSPGLPCGSQPASPSSTVSLSPLSAVSSPSQTPPLCPSLHRETSVTECLALRKLFETKN